MRDRRDPWKWPVSLGLTLLLLLAGPFLLPRAWLEALLSPLELAAPAAAPRPWLILIPPPQVEVAREPAPARRRPPPPAAKTWRDADWWTRNWRVRVVEQAGVLVPAAPTDSLRVLLDLLGAGPDLLGQAQADSLLARRLLLLSREQAWDLETLKPYLDAARRGRTYADILARSADLFEVFLEQEIQVTR